MDSKSLSFFFETLNKKKNNYYFYCYQVDFAVQTLQNHIKIYFYFKKFCHVRKK